MRVLKPLEEVELVQDHLLITPDILLQDNLDSYPAIGTIGLPDDAIGTCAERPTETVLGSDGRTSVACLRL